MNCKGCRKKIESYHEMIIDVNSIESHGKATFWHGDCFARMILKMYEKESD